MKCGRCGAEIKGNKCSTMALEEYESIMRENKRLKDVLKRHGITLLTEDK